MQWLKWYRLAGGVSLKKGTKGQSRRPKGPRVGVGFLGSSPPASESEDCSKLPQQDLAESPKRSLGLQKSPIFAHNTIHQSFWPPISIILHSQWAWQFLARLSLDRSRRDPSHWPLIATPHVNHCTHHGQSSPVPMIQSAHFWLFSLTVHHLRPSHNGPFLRTAAWSKVAPQVLAKTLGPNILYQTDISHLFNGLFPRTTEVSWNQKG